MPLDLFESVMVGTLIASLLGSVVFGIFRLLSVRGSHRRYVAATLEAGCEIGVIIAALIAAGINTAQQDQLGAGIMGAVAVWRLIWFLKGFDDDDHWFNRQWKRLKRSLKDLRKRITRTSPLPSPSPA